MVIESKILFWMGCIIVGSVIVVGLIDDTPGDNMGKVLGWGVAIGLFLAWMAEPFLWNMYI